MYRMVCKTTVPNRRDLNVTWIQDVYFYARPVPDETIVIYNDHHVDVRHVSMIAYRQQAPSRLIAYLEVVDLRNPHRFPHSQTEIVAQLDYMITRGWKPIPSPKGLPLSQLWHILLTEMGFAEVWRERATSRPVECRLPEWVEKTRHDPDWSNSHRDFPIPTWLLREYPDQPLGLFGEF